MAMSDTCRDFLDQCLLFDIEANEQHRIYSIGASFRGRSFLLPSGKAIGPQQLDEFEEFGAEASFILGHNILAHDIPRLREIAPNLPVLGKPAIDTLYLSPLAFPANPYHRLVKNYRIVRLMSPPGPYSPPESSSCRMAAINSFRFSSVM